MVGEQRRLAAAGECSRAGHRERGAPDSDVKIFLVADPAERARAAGRNFEKGS